jgi:uncharacterized membrane protein (Fun14 family)
MYTSCGNTVTGLALQHKAQPGSHLNVTVMNSRYDFIYSRVAYLPAGAKTFKSPPARVVVLDNVLALLGPLVIGFLVGVLAKRVLSLAAVLIALFIALAALGYLSPDQVTAFLKQLGYAANEALAYATRIKNAIPYSSITFLIGLALGLWKG